MRVNCPRCLGNAAIIFEGNHAASVDIPPDTIAQCAFRREHGETAESCPHLKRAIQTDVLRIARVRAAGLQTGAGPQGG